MYPINVEPQTQALKQLNQKGIGVPTSEQLQQLFFSQIHIPPLLAPQTLRKSNHKSQINYLISTTVKRKEKRKPEMGDSRERQLDQEPSAPATEMEAPLGSDEFANTFIFLEFVFNGDNEGQIYWFRFHSHFTILRPKSEEYEQKRFICRESTAVAGHVKDKLKIMRGKAAFGIEHL